MQPIEWNSAICSNLKVSLRKWNSTICIDVSETVPKTKYTVKTSEGTIRMAFTSMWGLFGAMVIAEIVNYKKYPRSMGLNFFDHWTLFWLPNRQFLSDFAHLLWASSTWAIIGDKLGTGNHFRHVFTDFQKIIRARWGSTFLITEFCFGHHFVNFSPIRLI